MDLTSLHAVRLLKLPSRDLKNALHAATIFHTELLLLHNAGKEKYVWNTGDPLQCLLVLPESVIKVNENYNKPIQAGLLETQTLQE